MRLKTNKVKTSPILTKEKLVEMSFAFVDQIKNSNIVVALYLKNNSNINKEEIPKEKINKII